MTLNGMPEGVHDGWGLPELRGDQSQHILGEAGDVDLNVQLAGGAEFGDHSAGKDVQVVKRMEHARQRERVSFGVDA